MLRNFLTLSTGEAVSRGIHAFAILLLVRILKPDALGVFELAISITAYAVLAVQQGFDAIAIREVSREPQSASGWLTLVRRLRMTFAIPVISAMLLAGTWQIHRPMGPLLVILSLSSLASALTPRWVFLAREMPRFPALAGILSQLIFLSTVVFAVRSPEHTWRAALGWVAGELAALILLKIQVARSKKGTDSLFRDVEPNEIKNSLRERRVSPPFSPFTRTHLLRESWPISLSMLLGQIMYNFDVLALAAMGRQSEIGLYLAAYRFVTIFAPILQQFQASISPPLARAHSQSQTVRGPALKMALGAAGVGLALSLFLYFASAILVERLFGPEYLAAVPYLRVLAWMLPLQAIRMVTRQALVATHRQGSDIKIAACGAATNVILDLLLIPALGAMGCAVSTLCSGVVLVGSSWYFAGRARA